MSDLLAPPSLVFRRRSTMEALALDHAPELGAGGEARVMSIPGDDSLVAKLYHEPTLAKARKVALMMADEPALDASAAALAWPRDLLLEAGGGFAGFLMERAEGPRVFELYNPSTRRHAAPRSDYALLHRVGANVAAAFEALHARGYVIGDVNESNVLVRPGGAVTLVDTDSMQVPDRANETVLRSRVGKPEFTPPELQGRSFGDFDRSPEHDRFGLAVLLFLLLMEGTHPFAGRMADGSETPPVEERIRRGLFPHGMHREIHPPKLAPDIDLLHPGLRSLFVRAFVDGHRDPAARPTAAEWRAALAAAEAKLGTCAENECHRFGAHLESCPWCRRAALLRGRDPFPATAEPKPKRRPRGTNRVSPAPVAPFRPPKRARPVSILNKAKAPASPPAALPTLGPSGLRHPLSWVLPAAALILLGPALLQVVGVMALVAVVGSLLYGAVGRITLETVCTSALLLAIMLGMLLPAGPAATDSGGFGDIWSTDPHTLPAGVAARLGSASTMYPVDAQPEMLNHAEAERELAERLYHARIEEAHGVRIALWVRSDGTVDPDISLNRTDEHRDLVTAATYALRMLRFRPLTTNGAPTPAIVWVEIGFDRPVVVPPAR
jgi:hypothetical protein